MNLCRDNRIFEITIDEPLLVDGSELLLYLAQTPPPTSEQIFRGEASTETMPFLESFLLGDISIGEPSRLEAMAPPGNHTAIILIPEFAISITNWERMDELVRGMSRPAVVIGGLGYAKESELKQWEEAQPSCEGATKRVFGFQKRVGFGVDEMFFNVACCWIRLADGSTKCVLFLKNFLEQREEALKERGLEEGNYLLCLSAPDLAIYPLICAEFTCNRAGDRPLDRVGRNSSEKDSGKRVVIAGIAYQNNEVHSLWQRGIYSATSAVRGTPVVTVIVNNALWFCHRDESMDKWRCLTGVYVDKTFQSSQAVHPPIRCLSDDNTILGVLVRTNLAGVFSGKVSWDFGGGGTRYLWRATRRAIAAPGGRLMKPDLGDSHWDELYRIIKRFSSLPSSTSTDDEKLRINNENRALGNIDSHLIAHGQPDAKHLMNTILYGLKADLNGDGVDPDTLHSIQHRLMLGLSVMGVLKSRATCNWQNDVANNGQLFDNETMINILVWSDPTRGCLAISKAVEIWARDFSGKKPLLVVADGCWGDFEKEGIIKATRRADISSSGESGITSPREISNKAYILRMGRVENCLDSPDFITALNGVIQHSLDQLTQ